MKAESSKPVPDAEIKKVLEERKKGGEELGYEQVNALEHADAFVKADEKKANALVKKLLSVNEKLDEETAVKIANVMPKTPELLKTILSWHKTELGDEEVDALLKVIE
jgi:DNA-directed RNA polymerase subunit F